ncbi:MAG: phosphoribosylamine--glycine ligase [Nitrososphaerota archaeon]|nr:phosphoribosylamine--glycine ligase [Nitrososphaerota archaeon]
MLGINVLVVGSGGREHAIAWKILQSDYLGELFVAPGNGATSAYNVPINADDVEGLCEFARKNSCFTIVGPEAPLALGIVDRFRKEGLRIFGPTKAQAKLETSKTYAKEFMIANGIPTAKFAVFVDVHPAIDFAKSMSGKVAVKADGLAAGKGVFVCGSEEEAERAIKTILEVRAFGEAGRKIVVEERLDGDECSLMTICNGKTAMPFGTARDHKRVFDGDKGPNTGGMGAYSPSPDLDQEEIRDAVSKITGAAVHSLGYHGFLYLGLMITDEGPKLLEFNARLGDPETQVILPRLESDLLSVLDGTESGNDVDIRWSKNHCATVVMCSEGYPQKPKTSDRISGIDAASKIKGTTIFHSGTVKNGEQYFTSGGRVLSVTGVGKTLDIALERTYVAVSSIAWRGEHHRTDIGRACR